MTLIRLKKQFSALNTEAGLIEIAKIVILFAILLSLPALSVPLGLPAEEDAIDYRVPILKWILRHHQYPNWPWSVVDDYPMFGELLILPFFSILPNLGRIVPLLAYFGIAYIASKLLKKLVPSTSFGLQLCFAAWILSFRPILIQSNLFLVDNIAAFFVLLSLFGLISENLLTLTFGAGLALGTRYSTWGYIFLIFTLLTVHTLYKKIKITKLFTSILITLLIPSVFLIRNYKLNFGNPVFPLFNHYIGFKNSVIYNGYGRYGFGTTFIDLIKLPYNILIKNEFQSHQLDYTLGKLFYLQIFVALIVFIYFKKEKHSTCRIVKKQFLTFTLGGTLAWFYSSQQLRFLTPALILILMSIFIIASEHKSLIFLLTLFCIFPIISVQKESILSLFKLENPSYIQRKLKNTNACLDTLPNQIKSLPIALLDRETTLGFFDFDFYFLPEHPYSFQTTPPLEPQIIYIGNNHELNLNNFKSKYQIWPSNSQPCFLIRNSSDL